MNNTAAYIRTSTLDQCADLQEQAVAAWAKVHGVELAVYRDAFTGTTMDRPGWNALEAAIRAGRIDTLVVWKIDRLGRTASGLTALFDDLTARKVRFISLTEALDLATPMGRLVANILASVAAFETEVRRERQAAGIAAAKANGKTWGGSAARKGWTKVSRGTAKAIMDLRAAGTSIASIAELVHLSYPTVSKVIKQTGPGVPATTR